MYTSLLPTVRLITATVSGCAGVFGMTAVPAGMATAAGALVAVSAGVPPPHALMRTVVTRRTDRRVRVIWKGIRPTFLTRRVSLACAQADYYARKGCQSNQTSKQPDLLIKRSAPEVSER